MSVFDFLTQESDYQTNETKSAMKILVSIVVLVGSSFKLRDFPAT